MIPALITLASKLLMGESTIQRGAIAMAQLSGQPNRPLGADSLDPRNPSSLSDLGRSGDKLLNGPDRPAIGQPIGRISSSDD